MTEIAKLSSAENFQGPLVSAPSGIENTVGPEGQRSFYPAKEGVSFENVLAATKGTTERAPVRTAEGNER